MNYVNFFNRQLLLMNIDRIAWQAKKNFMQGGRGFFLCPHGQRVGSAPNVHESPQ